VRIAHDRLSHWVGKGAQMSDTVARLAKKLAKAAPAAA
jgi:ribosomal protein S16